MHTPTVNEIDRARVQIAELEQQHNAMELDSPNWKRVVWAQAGIEGWLIVAQRDGCVLTSLDAELKRGEAIMAGR